MKKLLFPIILFFGLSFNLKAQDRIEEAANFAADYMCNCVNKVYAEIDPEIRDIIIKLSTMSEDDVAEMMGNLSEETIIKIGEQSEIMSSEEKSAEFEACNNKMVDELTKKYSDVDEADISEEEMLGLILDRLSKKKKCEFTYVLMKIGMAQNTEIIEEENVNDSDSGEEGQ
jgi:hypothetical protein